jgi:flagellar biosynthesis protein FlhG
MKDQADRLRKLMRGKTNDKKGEPGKDYAKVLAITSGKGGVGKTNFAINLGISLRRLGHSVLIFDADIGLANIEIIAGTSIKYTIADLFVNNKDIYEIIGEGPEGIKIISGGSGFNELSMMNDENICKLLKEIEKLESSMDFIIIDTGAGVSNIVLDFIMTADEVIVITTPDPTSLMDSYTVIKALTINGYKGKLNVVTNIVNNGIEAMGIYNKLNRASNNFLNIELNFLGYLEKSNIVTNAVKNQQPFLLSNPSSTISKRINIMASSFVDPCNLNAIKQESSFTQKLKNLFFGRGVS